MKERADNLRSQVDSALASLGALTEADVTAPRGPGKWVKKEILGHLIDSAANNHQRFVRAQLAESYAGPGYEQEAWVAAQRYRQRPWTELVELWAVLNRHVAHAMESVPAAKLQTRCTIGDAEPVTLEWLMRDYLRHLRHHLAQILS
ncbi:MAG: DinB family protein [Acidobacteria bacterium]|nr:DinB family protein [Acidobacteriota bacterium]